MVWLTGWAYRKSHIVNGTTAGAQTNYQVKVKCYYGSGVDSGEDVYLNNHGKTDFGDVRFTKSDQVTLLDYWMEEKVNSSYAIFWVEVESIPASPGTTTIYVYYGKSDETTTSSGPNSFQFFDDFEAYATLQDAINGQWRRINTNHTLAIETDGSKVISLLVAGTGRDYLLSDLTTFTAPCVLRARIKQVSTHAPGNGNDQDFGIARQDGTGAPWEKGDGFHWNPYWATQNIYRYIGGANGWQAGAVSFSGSWHIWEAINDTDIIICRMAEVQVGSLAGTAFSARSVGFAPARSGGATMMHVHVDWFLVRLYADPEPSHGSWGAESTLSYNVEGVTRNSVGSILGSCIVWLFRSDTKAYVTAVTSNASTGVYIFTGLSYQGAYFLRAHKDGTPNVFGTTDDEIIGVQE